jgi:hypothetical protein
MDGGAPGRWLVVLPAHPPGIHFILRLNVAESIATASSFAAVRRQIPRGAPFGRAGFKEGGFCRALLDDVAFPGRAAQFTAGGELVVADVGGGVELLPEGGYARDRTGPSRWRPMTRPPPRRPRKAGVARWSARQARRIWVVGRFPTARLRHQPAWPVRSLAAMSMAASNELSVGGRSRLR